MNAQPCPTIWTLYLHKCVKVSTFTKQTCLLWPRRPRIDMFCGRGLGWVCTAFGEEDLYKDEDNSLQQLHEKVEQCASQCGSPGLSQRCLQKETVDFLSITTSRVMWLQATVTVGKTASYGWCSQNIFVWYNIWLSDLRHWPSTENGSVLTFPRRITKDLSVIASC